MCYLLNGSFPKSLTSLSKLRVLDISLNLLKGVVSEVHFANLRSLTSFYAFGNLMTLRVSPDWIPPFNLRWLEIGYSWNLGPQFPIWLKTQTGLRGVDLYKTKISGVIPNWFWNLSSSFHYINMCHNQLYGELPAVLPIAGSSIIYLCSNKFNGTLPHNSFAVSELNLSNNSFSGDISKPLCHPEIDNGIGYVHRIELAILDLGGNLLSGKICDCWMKWPSLRVIDLSDNNLTGEIPSSMGSLKDLESLHLRSNSLSEEIPLSLRNCTMLTNLDLGLNNFVGSMPRWIGVRLSNLMILIVRSNKMNGKVPHELCHLARLQILDAADNNLSSSIPSCFNNFSAMAIKNHSSDPISYSKYVNMFIENAFLVTKGREYKYDRILRLVTILDLSNNNLSGEIPKQLTSLQEFMSLNLSRNNLRGSIPDKIGDMGSIESLDISRNQLFGKIPPSMSNLNFLSYLNVSYNNFSGEIPLSTQLQSFNASSFIGNQLCGPPLPKRCKADQNTAPTGTKDEQVPKEGDGDEEEYWFYFGVGVGFVVGFLGVISPLVFYGFNRHAYYWFFHEYLCHKILELLCQIKRIIMRN